MIDFLFDSIADLLSFFFDLTGSIGLSIILLTVAIMGLTAPLTMKGTRSMMKLQRLQPEMKRIQQQYKGDRERLNQELMAFYQANNLNPLGGCLPLILQFPIFIVLFQVLRGLGNVDTNEAGQRIADPKYLEHGSALYDKIVDAGGQLISFGFDLADAATSSHESFVAALPYYLLIAAMAGTQWFQQRQAMGRRDPDTPITPQQQMTQRLMVVFLPLISLSIPAGVVIYWVVSNVLRIGQQWLIHYLDTRERERAGEVLPPRADGKQRPGSRGAIDTTAKEANTRSDTGGSTKGPAPSNGDGGRTSPPGSPRPHPRSKKKRKKKRKR